MFFCSIVCDETYIKHKDEIYIFVISNEQARNLQENIKNIWNFHHLYRQQMYCGDFWCRKKFL